MILSKNWMIHFLLWLNNGLSIAAISSKVLTNENLCPNPNFEGTTK